MPLEDQTKRDLDRQFEQLSREWEPSPQRQDLIRQIREKIIPNERIVVDSAICLGLGSLEEPNINAPLPAYGTRDWEDESRIPDHWEDDIDPVVLEPIGNGEHRNWGLYQLIVFETVLECLRERFKVETVRFQDPAFTTGDIAFLEQRGYTVLPWLGVYDKGGDNPCDPKMLSLISSSTMFFAPFLDRPVVVEVVCASTPYLYLGNELLVDVVHQLLRHPNGGQRHLMNSFEDFVLSRDFVSVKAFGGDTFSLMWPADMNDEKVLSMIQNRWAKVDEARAGNFGWDRWNAHNPRKGKSTKADKDE